MEAFNAYLNVVEYANEVFREITNKKNDTIKNKYFLKKLNDICTSNDYFEILTREHEKKPTESKLIDYIKGIVKLWIKFIIEGDIEHFQDEFIFCCFSTI